jgi:hypothetical protein
LRSSGASTSCSPASRCRVSEPRARASAGSRPLSWPTATSLSDLEIQLEAGILPVVGGTENEQDPFRIELDVKPFEMPLPEEPAEAGDGAELPSPEDDPGAAALGSLLEIELTVTWLEGGEERSVGRTTYALDLEAVSELLEGPAEGEEGR